MDNATGGITKRSTTGSTGFVYRVGWQSAEPTSIVLLDRTVSWALHLAAETLAVGWEMRRSSLRFECWCAT